MQKETVITNPQMRKKEPEEVRARLIECASAVAATQGLDNLRLDAIAKAAGVTKGGLLHHFPSKADLIKAVFETLLDDFTGDIQKHIDADKLGGYGTFTRAYVSVVLQSPTPDTSWSALSLSVMTNEELKGTWEKWNNSHLKKHSKTDSDTILEIVRCAADGVWLADISNTGPAGSRRKAIKEQLLAMAKHGDA